MEKIPAPYYSHPFPSIIWYSRVRFTSVMKNAVAFSVWFIDEFTISYSKVIGKFLELTDHERP